MSKLNRIQLAGFKSLSKIDLKLRQLNLLIGPNGTGKSNFIDFFRFMHQLVQKDLQFYLARQGGSERFLHFGRRIRYELPPLLGSFDIVTTFYDLYGFKRRQGRRAEQLEQDILKSVAQTQQHRLIPYIQQYEFEALIFAAPAIVAEELGMQEQQTQISAIIQKAGEPERINDSISTCPSKRLKRLFPHYDKKFHGPNLCQRIGLSNIRQACPRFNHWLNQLENIR